MRRLKLCAMGRSAGFGYPLWAVAKDLVKAVGYGAAFGCALWAIENQLA
jgi:hypothetical protein